MSSKGKELLRRYAYIPGIIGFFLVLLLAYEIYHAGPHIPANLSAEETVEQYLTFWQEEEYGSMARMWHSYHHFSYIPPFFTIGFRSSLKEEKLVTIEKVWEEPPSSSSSYEDSFYAVKHMRVTFKVDRGNGPYEDKEGFTLVKTKENRDWRILDQGYV